eukprot:133650_1
MWLSAMVLLVCATQHTSMLLGFSHIATWRRHGLPTVPQRCNFVTSSLTQRQQDINCLNAAASNLSNSSCPGYLFEPKGLDGLITYLAQHPSSEWHPDVIQMHEVALTHVGEYEAAMNRHKRHAELSSSPEDMKMLEEVDGFLMGLAKQMRRVAAREKISAVLLASTTGPEEFDKVKSNICRKGTESNCIIQMFEIHFL